MKRLAIVGFDLDYLARAFRSRSRLAQCILEIRLTVAFQTVRGSLDNVAASRETLRRRFGAKFACLRVGRRRELLNGGFWLVLAGGRSQKKANPNNRQQEHIAHREAF